MDQDQEAYLVLKEGCHFTPSRQLKKKLEKTQKWVLDMGKYEEQNCAMMFEAAKEVAVHRMWIGFNSNPKILIQIADTHFKNLKEIWLSKTYHNSAQNKIESIQILTGIKMQNLEQIHLRKNRIVSVRSMRRCQWPKIQVISIYGNRAHDLMSMSEMNAPNLNTFWTEYEKRDSPQPHDMSWMAKLQSSCMTSICAASSKRIKQLQLFEVLRTKSSQKLSIHLYDT